MCLQTNMLYIQLWLKNNTLSFIYMKMYDSDKPDSDIKAIGKNVEQHTMGIAISSKVFSMNIDGIYQDKYGSTVRELSTNALDIHKKCGITDKPFDIHVPSELHGKFILRDYGCGLSKDDIIEYFGKLFSSSKDQENDSVGFFGIGCKSPFTVTDDFLVISIHDHIKTEYAFSRENKGTPRCIVLSSKETDEPSGISIVIDSGETEVWLTAIRNQLLMFPTKPNVYMDGELIDVGYYDLKKYGDVYYGRGLPKQIYINQGGVIYPIDEAQFPDVKFRKARLSNSFVIYTCDIGLITVPPDRERIEISSSNIDNLTKIVDDSNANIDDDISKYFFDNYTDTYKSLYDLCSKDSHLVDIRSVIKSQLQNPIYDEFAIKMIGAEDFHGSLNRRLINWYSSFLKAKASQYSGFNGKYHRLKQNEKNMISMFDGSSTIPIIVLPYNSTISLAHHLYSKSHRNPYIFRCNKGCEDAVAKMLESYKQYFGSTNEIIVVTSAVASNAQKQVASKVANNPVIKDIHKFYTVDTTKNQNSYYMRFELVEDTPSNKDDFYLMEIDNDGTLSTASYSNQLKDAQRIVYSGLLDKPIYFMRSKYFRHFKYGIKLTYKDLLTILANKEGYYDLIFETKCKDGWAWSNSFEVAHRKIIEERFKTKPNKEIESICETLNIDLSVRKHSLKDVFEKLDAFSNMKNSDLQMLKNINISSKDVRGVVKQYFIKEIE